MQIYNEKYFNKSIWILENINRLDLKPDQAIVLLEIDQMNNYKEEITIDTLCKKANLSNQQLDKVLEDLCNNGFLKLSSRNGKVSFDITPLFSAHSASFKQTDVFSLFETEFNRVLTQKEMQIINEWLRIYDEDTIINALRDASINDALNFKYIDKILVHSNEKKQ